MKEPKYGSMLEAAEFFLWLLNPVLQLTCKIEFETARNVLHQTSYIFLVI